MSGTRLERRQSITLDGTGAGSATFGPGRSTETWTITRMTTDGSSTKDPTLDVLRGTSSVVDTTPHGNQDVSETDLPLLPGEFITARYTGGTAGAVMTFYLEGTVDYA